MHYYRGEITRMAGWRDRLDQTSNWAITVIAAMLSVSLSTPIAHHGVLLFAMLVVLLLLWIEARRYRFFDVYRARVRQIERNYFAEVFEPRSEDRPAWSSVLAEDLRRPCFLITARTAVSRRLRRNYIWMFLILLLGWILKISSPSLQESGVKLEFVISLRQAVGNAALGPFPGWTVLVGVSVFYCAVLVLAFRADQRSGELAYGEVHV